MHPSRESNALSRSTLILSAAACVVIAIALWMGPALLRPDLYSDDATQHTYWLYRFVDPALFPGDPSIEYFSSLSVAGWGYRWFYAALAPLGDALLVSKCVAVLLLAVTGFLAWRLGSDLETDRPELTGLLAVMTTMALLPFVDLLPNVGFQRTFALPVTLLCIWGLATRRYRWAGVSWVAAALIYPVIVPVLGLTAGFVFLRDLVRDKRMPPAWIWNAVLGVLAVALVLLSREVPPGIGPMVTFAQAMAMPEFSPSGRQSLFGEGFRAYWFGHHRTGLGWSPKLVCLLIAATAVTVFSGQRRVVPPAVWLIAAIGVILWFVARLTLFDLYLPNRHSRWALAAFAVIVIPVALAAVIGRFVPVSDGRSRGRIMATRVAAVAAPIVVALALYPSASRAWHGAVDGDLERAYVYLRSLPSDTLVAAHPTVADAIPLRTRHSVLASTETWISFQLGYRSQLVPRLDASLHAAYASTWQDFDSVLQPYGVDVFVVAPYQWGERSYSAPFEGLVTKLMQVGEQQGFVLRDPPPERILFRSGAVTVVKVGQAATR